MYWQYNGCAYWEDIVNWCNDHIAGRYKYNGWETLQFLDPAAYTAFILRWA
jgi:hypothetical protein